MGALKHKHFGQAMTETIIAASFVLVPLFLLIPLLGKYIDIQHSTIQAARYEAWEYTVWYRKNSEKPTGVKDKSGNGIPLPTKDFAELQAEARQRFFSADAYSPDSRVSKLYADDNTRWDIADTNPLWRTHRQDPANPANNTPILTSATNIDSVAISSDFTPRNVTTLLVEVFATAVDSIFTFIGNIISWANPNAATFDAINLKGYSKSDMTLSVTTPPGMLNFGTLSGTYAIGKSPPVTNLTFNSKAAVLSDGWNAGGSPHVINQAGGMVPTKLLNNVFDGMRNNVPGFTFIENMLKAAAPELRACNPPFSHPLDDDDDGSLWLGYLDTEAIHPDRLHDVRRGVVNPNHIGGGTNNQGHTCKNNICSFAYNAPNQPNYTYPYGITGYPDECN